MKSWKKIVNDSDKWCVCWKFHRDRSTHLKLIINGVCIKLLWELSQSQGLLKKIVYQNLPDCRYAFVNSWEQSDHRVSHDRPLAIKGTDAFIDPKGRRLLNSSLYSERTNHKPPSITGPSIRILRSKKKNKKTRLYSTR